MIAARYRAKAPMLAPPLTDLLNAAFAARQPLIARLDGEDTNAYRLFNGSGENRPGLTVDRYGDLLLIQTFHTPLDGHDRVAVERFYADALPGLVTVYNDRSGANSRVANPLPAEVLAAAQKPREFLELGIRYLFQARHAGQDPWLFLDLRAGRRRVMQEAAGKSVLNLFAYTCGVGVAAARAGALPTSRRAACATSWRWRATYTPKAASAMCWSPSSTTPTPMARGPCSTPSPTGPRGIDGRLLHGYLLFI